MSFFRSEPMTMCQIILHTESAFDCLVVLGYEGKIQFRNIYDGNVSINNQFKNEETRCQELKRILNYLQEKVTDNNIKKVIYPDVDMDEAPEADDLKNMESEIQEIYDDLKDIGGTVKLLIDKRLVLYESLQVVQKAEAFFGTMPQASQPLLAFSDSVTKMLMQNELNAETHEGHRLSFFSGTIPVEKFHTFEILLWRVTLGFFHLKHEEYIPTTEEKAKIFPTEFTRKYVFLVFFMGHEIRTKIAKLCQGFGIKLFECPESQFERRILRENLKKDLFDLDVVIRHTQEHLNELLQVVSADLYIWQIKVQKMLMVYYVLNRMSRIRHLHVDKYLQAEGWVPTKDIPTVRRALNFGARRAAKGNFSTVFQPILNEKPQRRENEFDKPTLFELNKFTKGFQNLVDSYGIAQYQELNPAPYTIITFPFLFAVMFGDMGHGLILFLFGMFLVLKENSIEEKIRFGAEQSEILNILFSGRYVITLMGAFSIYTGFIYNDCFSKSLNLFGSSWFMNATLIADEEGVFFELDPLFAYMGVPYVIGMDPVWKVSGDKAITIFNSLKMKMAIILGVFQMIFGLVLSACNFAYKSEYVDLILVFFPQITFLVCIFLYLVFLIFLKWYQYGTEFEAPYDVACAPSILIMFINMVMMKGHDEPPEGCEPYMFEEQPYFETFLMTVALVSVPVLFAGKPIYYMIQERKIERIKNEQLKSTRSRIAGRDMRKSLMYAVDSTGNLDRIATMRNLASENDTILSELWIHSAIHCIESILGSVSHTASYLRLWALSLAHEQLSTVLWNMVMDLALQNDIGSYWDVIFLYFVFMIWAVLTVTILVTMEGLSAFLHTLRLHWVEFQSKFYVGNGEPFRPFKFQESSPNNIF